LDRFLKLLSFAQDDPGNYYYRFTQLPLSEVKDFAHQVWTSINLTNLQNYIEPTRNRAEVILHKSKNHEIDAFGDAYEYLMTMYASNAGKSGGEFSDALGLLRDMLVAHVLGDDLLLVARCTGAGAGGDDDGVPLAVEHGLEGLDVVTGDLRGVFEVAGVCVHLSAADLVFREDDFVAEALEQRDCRLGGLGEHDVCQASGEKSDTHWGSFLVGAVAHQYGWVRGPGRPIVWGLRWGAFGGGGEGAG